MELFDPQWAKAWQRALTEETDYHEKGVSWDAPVVLQCRDGDGWRGVYAELSGGACRLARPATEADCASAPFVLSMEQPVWDKLISRKLDPMFAVMTGKLKLTRGTMSQLLPHASAAKELVSAARFVEEGRAAKRDGPDGGNK